MSADILPAPTSDQPFTAAQAAEHIARTDYLAAVQHAQRQYDADVKAALDVYHRAERLAWHTYVAAARAAAALNPAAPPPPRPGTPVAAGVRCVYSDGCHASPGCDRTCVNAFPFPAIRSEQ